MNSLRLKFAGLTGVDKNTIKSILRLSVGSLTKDWIIIEDGQADLVIYCFETDAGQQAWLNRSPGMTALLSTSVNIAEPVNIIIRKPLYKETLIAVLNLVDEKLSHPETAEPTPQTLPAPKKISFFKRLLQPKIKPSVPKHTLELESADLYVSDVQVPLIKDPEQLQTRLHQLAHTPHSNYAAAILEQLKALNAQSLKPAQHLPLLEVFYEIIFDMLFTHDLLVIQRPVQFSPESQLSIQSLDQLLHFLSKHYQHVAKQLLDTPSSTDEKTWLFSLNRASECLCLQILHNFRYYRAIPTNVWHQLHQIYLYQEAAGSLHQKASLNQQSHSRSFFDLYVQIIVIALAEPYSLYKFDVFQLYTVLEKLTDIAQIRPLSDQDIQLSPHILLTGHFCIDTEQDHAPISLIQTDSSCRQKKGSRLLNLHALLIAIERMIKTAKSQHHASPETALQLVKKIIPQLNGTYDRREYRHTIESDKKMAITHGISAVNQSLSDTMTHTLEWQLINECEKGLMACRTSHDCYTLNIGDFVALSGLKQEFMLAHIKWLHINPSAMTTIGLELIPGRPVPIICIPDGEAEQHRALLLIDESHNEFSIITEKGLYWPNRKLQIKDKGEPQMIVATSLINSTVDYEHFNYRRHSGS